MSSSSQGNFVCLTLAQAQSRTGTEEGAWLGGESVG